jgi:hypothetical protein
VNAVDSSFGGDSFLIESSIGSNVNYWLAYVAP